MKFPVLWLYLEKATRLFVIDDYYVPPSINKVYTILVVSGSIFSDFNVCFDFPLIRVAIALNTRKMEH